MLTIRLMTEPWRTRLLEAIDASGRSDRDISRAAKLGQNAVNELRNTAKQPSVEKVIKIAEEVGVSLSYLFLGIEASAEDDRFLKLLSAASQQERDAVQLILGRAGRAQETE
jgi:transcriptional regulator with XRE-family HTH domain